MCRKRAETPVIIVIVLNRKDIVPGWAKGYRTIKPHGVPSCTRTDTESTPVDPVCPTHISPVSAIGENTVLLHRCKVDIHIASYYCTGVRAIEPHTIDRTTLPSKLFTAEDLFRAGVFVANVRRENYRYVVAIAHMGIRQRVGQRSKETYIGTFRSPSRCIYSPPQIGKGEKIVA